MPIYEYHCESCQRRVSVWVRRMGDDAERCPRCGGATLTRLVSRFAFARGDEARFDRLADDAALAGVDENDPKSVARFMKRMGKELGEEAGPEFEQAMNELESGRSDTGDDTSTADALSR
jgi:putative FmdB family regulatory protein